jgi:O-antigen/teichoic acid export membrane protein
MRVKASQTCLPGLNPLGDARWPAAGAGLVQGRIPPHLWVALSNWVSRAGSVIAQLVCLPLLTTLLKPAEFAAYAIAVSLLTWYQLTDWGVGNTVQNGIVEARALEQEVGPFIAVAGLIGGMTLGIAAGLILPLANLLDRMLFSNLHLPTESGIPTMMALSGLMLVCNALGTVAAKILYALQKGVYANLLTLVNSLGFLALLWGVAQNVSPGNVLLASVLAYTGPMAVTGLAALAYLCVRYAHWNWSAISNIFHKIRARAWRFWLFALLAAATLNVDYLIMSRTLVAEEIAAYNVLFRIFWVGMALYSGLLGATWPLFTAMGVRGDRVGVERHVRLYLLIGMTGLLIGTAVAALGLPTLLRWLAPGLSIKISILTLALFSAYIGLRIWTDTYAIALQALSEITVFLKVVPIQASLSISLQWILAKKLGIDGILLGLILSFIFTVAWLLPLKLRDYKYSHLTPNSPT